MSYKQDNDINQRESKTKYGLPESCSKCILYQKIVE